MNQIYQNRFIVAILFMVTLVAPTLFAFDNSVAETLLLHEIKISDAFNGNVPQSPIVIISSHEGRKIINPTILSQAIKYTLSRHGIISAIYQGDFLRDFEGEKLNNIEDLLAPKMALDIRIEKDTHHESYEAQCLITYIEYSKTGHPRPNPWSKNCDSSSTTGKGLETALGNNIQRQVEVFAAYYRGKQKRESGDQPRIGRNAVYTGHTNGTKLSYSLRWNDPDNKRGHLFVGASFGTPSVANAIFGYWGGQSFPIVTGLSGMYYGVNKKGVQFDLGWAFDNSGAAKQVIGVAFIGFNETTESPTYDKDIFGRVIHTDTEIIDALRPYIGPSYMLDWNNFRIQGGVTFKADSENQSTVRFILQVGYAPPLSF